MSRSMKVLQLGNKFFYNNTANKRAKKKKQVVLSTKLVFTIEWAKVLINTKKAIEEAKQRIKNTK